MTQSPAANRSRRFPWFTPPDGGRSRLESVEQAAQAATPSVGTAVPEGDQNARLLDEAFTRRLERLQIVSQRMHGAASHGGRRSKQRGTSVEFADYREYAVGDDLRQIDWNVYGRSERLFVKLREDEESLGVHLLLDCSSSMDWGRHHKLTYARHLAAALGYAGLVNEDRVEVAGFNARLTAHLPALRGRAVTGRLFSFINGLHAGGQTDLRAALRAYAAMHRRSGLAVLISDLLSPGGLEGLGGLLDRGFEVVLLHLLDPTEMDPEIEGEVELYDRETGHTVRASVDAATHSAYRRRVSDWLEETEAFCAKRMVRYLAVSTATPLEELMFRQLRARRIVA